MIYRDVQTSEKEQFDSLAIHPLQTYVWGEFRKKTAVTVIRRVGETDGEIKSAYQMTIHPLPFLPFTIGYVPKSILPTPEMLSDMKRVGKEQNCIYIQIEPNVIKHQTPTSDLQAPDLKPSHHALFTPNTFLIDLTLSEDDLKKNMHQKTRYNLTVSEKYHVEIKEDNSPEAFEEYLRLTQETAKRQNFYAHGQAYHETQWETLPHERQKDGGLSSHLLLATYTPPEKKEPVTLAAWILFIQGDSLFYPYGTSSELYREVMASTRMMWGAIQFGKRHHLKIFDLWGAAGTNDPDSSDPYYGFHRFKKNFGAVYTSMLGSFDLVIRPVWYRAFILANTLRWKLLAKS
jgi:lipid II:glycine glycyltransferase (peptidoglycan interpeptide bridge formation enzyme)